MNQVYFYQKLPEMKAFRGDTLDAFKIPVIGLDSLDGCSMLCILEEASVPGAVVLAKDCTPIDGGFQVQFTSEDTAKLAGMYRMHCCLTDANGFRYRKLAGSIEIAEIAQGA